MSEPRYGTDAEMVTQEARAEMLAFKRGPTPAALTPSAEGRGGYFWDCDHCPAESPVGSAIDPLPAGWHRVISKQGVPSILCDSCHGGPCLCGERTLSQCIENGCTLGASGSGSEEEISDEQYRSAASVVLGSDEHNVDDDAVVSRGSDAGAYVACWVWVPREDAEEQG